MNALRQSVVALMIATIVMLAGCDGNEGTPATRATTPTTSAAPVTRPASATFHIAGQSVTFACPRAQLERTADSTRLLIYSDKDDDSSSFYFEVPVEADTAIGDSIQWEQELPRVQTEESLVGIELGKTMFQPRTLKISVHPAGADLVKVELSGEFAPGDEGAPAVSVDGEFTAGVKK